MRLTRSITLDSETRELLGFVDVESGNLVISDPAYIQRHWTEHAYEDRRCFRHRPSGRVLQYHVDFLHFAQPIASEDGRSMNDLLATGEWEGLENPRQLGLSYFACSRATLSSDGGGQLVQPCSDGSSHLPIAVAVDFPGDGAAPVYVERNTQGRPTRLIIDLPSYDDAPEDEQSPEYAAWEAKEEQLQALCQAMVDDVVVSSRLGGDQPAGR